MSDSPKQLDVAMLGNSGFERNENDYYPTPANCTQALVNFLRGKKILTPQTTVWESACGGGHMVRVLKPHFPDIISTDIAPQMEGGTKLDFLRDEPEFGFDAILTNPPYSEVDAWIERCLHYVKARGSFAAMLMRHEVDCASSRKKFFESCPYYAARLILTWRPRWIEGSTGSPRHNYDWFCWAPNQKGRAQSYYAFRKDCEPAGTPIVPDDED